MSAELGLTCAAIVLLFCMGFANQFTKDDGDVSFPAWVGAFLIGLVAVLFVPIVLGELFCDWATSGKWKPERGSGQGAA